jgi:hypothetical protein
VAVVLRGVDDWRIVYEPKVEQVGNIEAIAPYSADTGARVLGHTSLSCMTYTSM